MFFFKRLFEKIFEKMFWKIVLKKVWKKGLETNSETIFWKIQIQHPRFFKTEFTAPTARETAW